MKNRFGKKEIKHIKKCLKSLAKEISKYGWCSNNLSNRKNYRDYVRSFKTVQDCEGAIVDIIYSKYCGADCIIMFRWEDYNRSELIGSKIFIEFNYDFGYSILKTTEITFDESFKYQKQVERNKRNVTLTFLNFVCNLQELDYNTVKKELVDSFESYKLSREIFIPYNENYILLKEKS